MSKITKALEKAARERRRLQNKRATVRSKGLTTSAVTPAENPTVGTGTLVKKIHIDPHVVVASDAHSPIAEQYRILRTNLHSKRRASKAKTFLVTSAVHGEGKSVTSLNLALSLAEQDHLRVLLIDADLRRGSQHKLLGLKNQKGLSTALENGGEVGNMLVRLPNTRLSVLLCGSYPKQPAELLDSVKMRRLLEACKEQFDVVIVDSPPILPVADAGILERITDGTMLVVRSGKTQRKTVLQAQTLLKQVKAKVIGCVLTHVDYYIPGYFRYYQMYRYKASQQPSANGNSADSRVTVQSQVTAADKK